MTLKFLKPLGIAYLLMAFVAKFLLEFEKISSPMVLLGIAIFLGYFLVRGVQSFQQFSGPNQVGWFIVLGIALMMICQFVIVWGGVSKSVPLILFTGLLFFLWYIEFKYTTERDLGFFLVVLFTVMGLFNSNF
jgi:hypothetical protein